MTVSNGIKRLLWFWVLMIFACVALGQEPETIDVSAWDMNPVFVRAENMFVLQRIDPASGAIAYQGFYINQEKMLGQSAYIYTKLDGVCYHGIATRRDGRTVYTRTAIPCNAFDNIHAAYLRTLANDLLRLK